MKCYYSTDGDIWNKGRIYSHNGSRSVIFSKSGDLIVNDVCLSNFEILFNDNGLTITGYKSGVGFCQYELCSYYVVTSKPRKKKL